MGRSYKYNAVKALVDAGISFDDAHALRRISMTLHRWHELECGDGNSHGSWVIVRGAYRMHHNSETGDTRQVFHHDDDGRPYLEHHHYTHLQGRDSVSYTLLPDRERGALRRLDSIMKRYPGWQSYVQGDPRGCALYILRPGDLETIDGKGLDLSANYTRGIAVCK